jgi:antitoxin ParD1/3/4
MNFGEFRETTMGTVRKTITLTDKQDQWVKAQIARGDYTNDSEYFRALVRRDQEQRAKLEALRDAVREGRDSGVTERTVAEIWAEAEARYKSKHA